MQAKASLGLPPLAGLCGYERAARPGFSVEDNVRLMRRYNYLKGRLYEASAAFMNPTPEWELKCAFSLHLYLDADHAQTIRERVAELREPPLHLDACPDPALEALMDELLRAEDSVERLAGIFGVLRPALRAAFQAHLDRNNPLFDHPTCRMLRILRDEEDEMLGWGAEALAALAKDEAARARAEAFQAHLAAYLKTAGGVSGEDERLPAGELPPKRAAAPFVPDTMPQRDARSREVYNFNYRPNNIYMDEAADLDERNLALMFKRFHEIDVPEMMSSIVLQTQGKPWKYYRDMGRQIWDEARHAMMGEVWFVKRGVDWSKYPNHVGWSMHLNLEREPIERHIILYYIEQSLMDGRTGKKKEWKIAQAAGDDLTTYFQDYDWADEVLHAQIGRRWLKPEVGGTAKLMERGREIAQRPTHTIDERAKTTPQVDWWPAFVRDVLGKESTSNAGMEDRLTPDFDRSKALASG